MVRSVRSWAPCDICGEWFPVSELTRRRWRTKISATDNRLAYSRPNLDDGSFWTTTATYQGEFSDGPGGHHFRQRLNSDNSTTLVHGSPTYKGSGLIRTLVPLDMSAWTNVTFGAEIGPFHEDATSLAVTLGLSNSDGASLTVINTTTTKSQRRVWWTKSIAELSALPYDVSAAYFYVAVNVDSSAMRWFCDCCQVNKDATSLQPYAETTGTAVDIPTDKMVTMVKVVCRKDRERLARLSRIRGTPRKEPFTTPSTYIEEG